MCLVDLPHVNLFVFLETGVDLVGFISFSGACCHDVGDLEASLSAVRAHLLNDGKDLIGDVLCSVKRKTNAMFQF